MIKCLIVEDEALARQVILSHLRQAPQLLIAGCCSNALEAIEILAREEIGLIFLDIQLPGMTGLNFLRSLQYSPPVILTTAHPEYALESYEFNVIDYLLKPISFERFTRAINKVDEKRLPVQGAPATEDFVADHIFIKSNNRFFKVNFMEIIYIEGMKDYLKIYTTQHRLITHQTMGEMEKLLPQVQFMRVHKSFIVAVAHIKTIYGNVIGLEKTTIPIGNSYKEKTMHLTCKKIR